MLRQLTCCNLAHRRVRCVSGADKVQVYSSVLAARVRSAMRRNFVPVVRVKHMTTTIS